MRSNHCRAFSTSWMSAASRGSPAPKNGGSPMHDCNRRAFLARRSMLAAGAALGAVALAPTGVSAKRTSGDFAVIDAALGEDVTNGAVLGVVAMGATPEGIVYDGAFGTANGETGAPMRDDTRF